MILANGKMSKVEANTKVGWKRVNYLCRRKK